MTFALLSILPAVYCLWQCVRLLRQTVCGSAGLPYWLAGFTIIYIGLEVDWIVNDRGEANPSVIETAWDLHYMLGFILLGLFASAVGRTCK